MAHRRYADREPLNLNMQGIIYQYKIGNKLYVGKTLALERKRQAKHKFEAFKLHKETPFARAIRKYGWDNVLAGYSVIERIEAGTKQELNAKLCERETYWIRTLDTFVSKLVSSTNRYMKHQNYSFPKNHAPTRSPKSKCRLNMGGL